MKKGFKYYLIVWISSVFIFNIINFVIIANTHFSIYWPAYLLIMLSFIGQAICAYIVYKSESSEKVFLNIPLFHISNVSLVLTIITVCICTLIKNIPNWCAVVCTLSVLLYNIIAVIATIATENKIIEIKNSNAENTSFMKEALTKLEIIMVNNKDDRLNKLYDLLKYSDPVSNIECKEIDEKILENINNIKNDYSIVDTLIDEVEERRILVKKGK